MRLISLEIWIPIAATGVRGESANPNEASVWRETEWIFTDDSRKIDVDTFELLPSDASTARGGVWNPLKISEGKFTIEFDLHFSGVVDDESTSLDGVGVWLASELPGEVVGDEMDLFNYRADFQPFAVFFATSTRTGAIRPSVSVLFNDGTPVDTAPPSQFGLYWNFGAAGVVNVAIEVDGKQVLVYVKQADSETWKQIASVSGTIPAAGYFGVSGRSGRVHGVNPVGVRVSNPQLTTTDAYLLAQLHTASQLLKSKRHSAKPKATEPRMALPPTPRPRKSLSKKDITPVKAQKEYSQKATKNEEIPVPEPPREEVFPVVLERENEDQEEEYKEDSPVLSPVVLKKGLAMPKGNAPLPPLPPRVKAMKLKLAGREEQDSSLNPALLESESGLREPGELPQHHANSHLPMKDAAHANEEPIIGDAPVKILDELLREVKETARQMSEVKRIRGQNDDKSLKVLLGQIDSLTERQEKMSESLDQILRQLDTTQQENPKVKQALDEFKRDLIARREERAASQRQSIESLKENAAELEHTVRSATKTTAYIAGALATGALGFGIALYRRMREMEKKHFL